MRSSFVQGAAALTAILVGVQVGTLRATRAQQDLRAEVEASARAMTGERDTAQLELERVVRELLRAERENALLRRDLLRTSARADLLGKSTALLRDQVGELHQLLQSEPPFLDVFLVPGAPFDRLRAEAVSGGSGPVRITEVEGQLWLDAELLDASTSPLDLVVGPGAPTPFFEFAWSEPHATAIASGAQVLQGMLCVAYQRTEPQGAPPFVERVRFRHDAARGDLLLGREGSGPFLAGAPLCDPDAVF